MMCDKNKRIKDLEQAVRQLVAHNNEYLKTRIQNRLQLRTLTQNASRLLPEERYNAEIQKENKKPCQSQVVE